MCNAMLIVLAGDGRAVQRKGIEMVTGVRCLIPPKIKLKKIRNTHQNEKLRKPIPQNAKKTTIESICVY